MLSVVLPLLACAIIVTPVVASARAVYKHELDQPTHAAGLCEGYDEPRFGQDNQSDQAETTLPGETTI